jgi:hypothetical protein
VIQEDQKSSSEAATVLAEKLPTVCPAGTSLQIVDSAKSMCLHLKGSTNADGSFSVSTTVNRPLITMPCATKGSATFANQVFDYDDSAGVITHTASGLVLSLVGSLRDGTPVTAVAPPVGAVATPSPTTWKWFTPYTGGLISSGMDNTFSLTDSQVHSGANVGLPVHVWRLRSSLPSGAPNANWEVSCQ